MKKRKIATRISALLVMLCMVLSFIPMTAHAQDSETLSKPTNLRWWIDPSDGSLYGVWDPVKTTDDTQYICNYRVDLYKDGQPLYGTTLHGQGGFSFSFSDYLNGKLSQFGWNYPGGDGTLTFCVQAVEATKDTDKETGNVSPWSDFSVGYDYKDPNGSTPSTPSTPTTPTTPSVTVSAASTSKVNGTIEFVQGLGEGSYALDIKPLEIQQSLADQNVKYLVDIDLLKDGAVQKVSDNKMVIKVALPDTLKGYDNYEVVYIVNGEIKERFPATVKDGFFSFETSHLSQYGIVATNNADTVKAAPKTGENMFLFASLFLMGGSVVAISAIFARNKKNA